MTSPVNDLFARALGLTSPWHITKTTFSDTDQELHIHIDFQRGGRFPCPACQQPDTPVHDTTEKQWRHLNFFQHKTFLHCRVPRVKCDKCGVLLVEVPWSHPGSGFTLLFEAFVLALAREMPVKALSRLLDEHDTLIWRIIRHYVDEARNLESYHDIHRIGIDETSRKRGHEYVSLFVGLDQSNVLFVTEGKGHGTVAAFNNDFHDHGGDPNDVTDVCCDMSPAFIEGVRENLPNARITFDRFHVMKLVNEAVDEVRRVEQWEYKDLKGSRYVWLKNPENLNKKQQEKLASLSQLNLKTARAWQIRLNLRDFWEQPKETAEAYLKRWYFWATHSRLQPIIQVAYTIKRHWQGIINFATSKITNGILEGINSKIQATRNKAKGYRSVDYFITMIYLIAGKLNFNLPT